VESAEIRRGTVIALRVNMRTEVIVLMTACSLAGCATTTTQTRLDVPDAEHDATESKPNGARTETSDHPLKGLTTAGAVVLGLDYATSWIAVLSTTTCSGQLIFGPPLYCHSFSGWLFLPVAGPVIALADNASKPTMPGEMAFYAISTGVNVVGLAAIIVGASYRAPSKQNVAFAPSVASDGRSASIGIRGTF